MRLRAEEIGSLTADELHAARKGLLNLLAVVDGRLASLAASDRYGPAVNPYRRRAPAPPTRIPGRDPDVSLHARIRAASEALKGTPERPGKATAAEILPELRRAHAAVHGGRGTGDDEAVQARAAEVRKAMEALR